MMNMQQENNIRDLSAQLERFRTMTVNPCDVSDSQLADLLDGLQELKAWISALQSEALRRLSSGEEIRGYDVHCRKYRVIENDAPAIEALKAYDPQAAEKCVRLKIAGINNIKKVIGKRAFEEVLGQYTVTRQSLSLVRKNNEQTKQHSL